MISSGYQLVTQNMEHTYAERIAMRYYNEAQQVVVEKTYRTYAHEIRCAVTSLREKIPDLAGRKICILSGNNYHYAVNIFALMLAGAVVVPLNQNKSWDELSYELDLVEPEAALWDGGDYPYNESLIQRFGDRLLPIDHYTACTVPAEISECADLDALLMIVFTSGTTGRSKGVMLSQRTIFSVMHPFTGIGERFCKELQNENTVLSHCTVLPMFHMAAFTCLFSWSMKGWALNLCSLRSFYRDIALMPSEAMGVVPVIMQTIHSDMMRGRRDRLGPLWSPVCGSASFDPQMLLDLAGQGMFIVQTYGLTETCGDGMINYAQDPKHIGAVGKPEGICEIKLDDGELCIRGDSVMLGYYKDPEATAQVIDSEGWFHTGDLARVDEEGYYFLTGRKKNLIILSSGENVSPEELEQVLGRCDAIQECLVKEKNRKICAVIRCPEDRQKEAEAYVADYNRTLPLYKRINLIEFCTEPLPRNATGKLVRK